MNAAPQLGVLVEVIASGNIFAIAGIDDDCVMRADDGAWFDISDVDEVQE